MAHMNKAHKMYGILDAVGDPPTPHSTSAHSNANANSQHGSQSTGGNQLTRIHQKTHSPPQSSTPQRPRLSHQASMPNYPCTTSSPSQLSIDVKPSTSKPSNDLFTNLPISPSSVITVNHVSNKLTLRDDSNRIEQRDPTGDPNLFEPVVHDSPGGKLSDPN
ncbi:hypothetical protein FGIG_03586 [Fasciola gigantica]|uniref:Uncharacterized protein n=1 Tax=Fasciola gigantica TaxID=46835 RepID=A0A504YBH3_FASGI|nr:hypothetical protein FGIG_03586 [Fasciola gigantica]